MLYVIVMRNFWHYTFGDRFLLITVTNLWWKQRDSYGHYLEVECLKFGFHRRRRRWWKWHLGVVLFNISFDFHLRAFRGPGMYPDRVN